MLPTGHRIQTYEILSPIGAGGFADVYRVRHVPSGRLFALKWLRPEHRSADILERFRREAQLQRSLKLPCVVPVLEVTRDDGDPASAEGTGLVMALHEDGSLADLLAARPPGDPLPPAVLRHLFVPLLDGLAQIHQRGVVHRDIKPANILLRRSPEGHLEGALTDFGIAHAPEPGPRMTLDGQRMGTLEYMSPEQRLNPRNIDHRADIYAIGAALLECATLRPPDPDQPDLSAVAVRDPLLAVVLQRALHPDRAQRFASCADMAAALRMAPAPTTATATTVPVPLLARLEQLEAAVTALSPHHTIGPTLPGLLGGELVVVGLGVSLLAAGGAPLALVALAGLAGGALIARTAWVLWRPPGPRLLREVLEVVLGGLLSAGALAWSWPARPVLHIALLWGLLPAGLVVLRLALGRRPPPPAPPPSEVTPPSSTVSRQTVLEG